MAQAAIDTDGESSDRPAIREQFQPSRTELAPETRRIVAGEATMTDVPERKRPRIAREVKAYADHFPDVGRSATVRRLIDDLKQAEVSCDEY